jgi:hypothetical protein
MKIKSGGNEMTKVKAGYNPFAPAPKPRRRKNVPVGMTAAEYRKHRKVETATKALINLGKNS